MAWATDLPEPSETSRSGEVPPLRMAMMGEVMKLRSGEGGLRKDGSEQPP